MLYAKDMLGKASLCRANSSTAGIPPGIRGQISFHWRVNVCLPGAHQRVWWGQELLKKGLAAPGGCEHLVSYETKTAGSRL